MESMHFFFTKDFPVELPSSWQMSSHMSMEEPINANETIYHDTLVVPPELEEDGAYGSARELCHLDKTGTPLHQERGMMVGKATNKVHPRDFHSCHCKVPCTCVLGLYRRFGDLWTLLLLILIAWVPIPLTYIILNDEKPNTSLRDQIQEMYWGVLKPTPRFHDSLGGLTWFSI